MIAIPTYQQSPLSDAFNAFEQDVQQYEEPDRIPILSKYFQAFQGGYAQGDAFLGIRVPNIRSLAKTHFRSLEPDILANELLQSPYHEFRLCALFMLIHHYKQQKALAVKEHIINLYIQQFEFVNNWDLVDTSAPHLLGPHLHKQNKTLLYQLAQSGWLWQERAAMVSCLYFIKKGDYTDALSLARHFLHHPHDLMHKAVGWMLREIGQKHLPSLITHLQAHQKEMPRTQLRYAIEKLDAQTRQAFMRGQG